MVCGPPGLMASVSGNKAPDYSQGEVGGWVGQRRRGGGGLLNRLASLMAPMYGRPPPTGQRVAPPLPTRLTPPPRLIFPNTLPCPPALSQVNGLLKDLGYNKDMVYKF